MKNIQYKWCSDYNCFEYKNQCKVEKKMLDTSSLVTGAVRNTKTSEVENKIPNRAKYITTQELKRLTAETFRERLIKQANLVNKTDFDSKLISFSK